MSVGDVERLVFGLRSQIKALADRVAVNRWGIVTGTDPLRVLQDGDSTGRDVYPSTLVSGLTVGDRVRVETSALRTLVTGRAGGQRQTAWCTARISGDLDVGYNHDLPLTITDSSDGTWRKSTGANWSIRVPVSGLYLLSGMLYQSVVSGTNWVDIGFQTHDDDGGNKVALEQTRTPANDNGAGVSIPATPVRLDAGRCVNFYVWWNGSTPHPSQGIITIARIGD